MPAAEVPVIRILGEQPPAQPEAQQPQPQQPPAPADDPVIDAVGEDPEAIIREEIQRIALEDLEQE